MLGKGGPLGVCAARCGGETASVTQGRSSEEQQGRPSAVTSAAFWGLPPPPRGAGRRGGAGAGRRERGCEAARVLCVPEVQVWL